VPQFFSDIIQKLVMIEPDDRYQSASGLLYDLRLCLEKIENFRLDKELDPRTHLTASQLDSAYSGNFFQEGENDFPQFLNIPPQKFCGSQENTELLLKIFRASKDKAHLFRIYGLPGSGKLKLVYEFLKESASGGRSVGLLLILRF
jgi:serine/threonine protein kinase